MKLCLAMIACAAALAAQPVFNVRDYGATGRKPDNARPPSMRAGRPEAARSMSLPANTPPGSYACGPECAFTWKQEPPYSRRSTERSSMPE
jgi:hypothetical protein